MYHTLSMCMMTAFMLFLSLSAFSQEKQLQGKIVNNAGAPIVGATVLVKGTSNGTTTDENGQYSIKANTGAVLVISSIGFSNKEVPVGDDASINVTLEMSDNVMDEVVVVGYGTQRKKDLTGAVSSVNLDERRDLPNTNIGQFLQGAVAGLNVGVSTISGGTPPISIRGRVTLSGNQSVLIILDGVQYNGSLSSINPDDIATIDVLKDASSTAVYGAQAANGVILLTTRRGKVGDKPRISFSSSYTLQEPTVGNLRPYDRDGFIGYMTNLFYDRAFVAPDYTRPVPNFNLADFIDPALRGSDGQLNPYNTNWFDQATGTGTILETNLSISGGSDRFNYFLSGALVDQSGFIINDKFKRKALRANLETKPLKWWKIGLQSSGSFVNQDGAEPSFGSINRMPPLVRDYDDNGVLIPFPTLTLEPSPFTTFLVDDLERNNYLFANLYSDMDLPFLKGLNYRINFGNNYRESQRYGSSIYGAGQTGSAFKNTQNYYDYTFDNILTYTKRFGDHDLSATLLYGAIERQFSSTNARAEGFTRLTLSYNNLALGTNRFVESNANAEALNYQMARVNYKYADKYLITGTLRRDGFSAFSRNYKYATFPVIALGWIASEENFLKNSKTIDLLKIRAGYGIVGNQTAQYTSIARVNTNVAYVFGDGGTTQFGQQVASLGNDNLRWEKTGGLNLGVDFGLMNNRLTGTLEFYQNKTNDLLYSINIPAMTGFNDIRTNVGQIDNTGFEAMINYDIIRNRNFSWNSTLIYSTNKNKIVTIRGIDANGDGIEDDLISSNLFIGRSIQTIFDYQLNGIYQLDDERLPGFPVGSHRIVDQDGDGDITQQNDRIILGRQEPAHRWSWNNTFRYKNLSLRLFVNAVDGGKDGYLGNNNPSLFREDNTIRVNNFRGIDFWHPNNPNGKYPMNISGTPAKFNPNFWQDRSFVRLQEVTLSYNLGAAIFKQAQVQSLNIFLSGRNLITWTNWDGWDPETGEGIIYGGRPVLRGATIGVNLNF